MNEQEIIDSMIKHKEESIEWLGSEEGKKESERKTVAALLRCLEVPFNPVEVKSIPDRFPDVDFRGNPFEIKELLEPDRKRHDEYKDDLVALKNARDLSAILEPYTPLDLTIVDVGSRIAPILKKLDTKYPPAQRNSTNLVIYFNIPLVSVEGAFHGLGSNHEWQSISVVGNGWAIVFHSAPNSPAFLTQKIGQLIKRYDCWNSVAI